MAKFELPIYDAETGEVIKTVKRGFMPVSLYVRFQKFSEKVVGEIKNDAELFDAMQPLFCELFPNMTKDEYKKQTDVAEVLQVLGDVMNKSTEFSAGNSKNA